MQEPTSVTIRLDAADMKRLAKLAKADSRTRTGLVTFLVRRFLETVKA